MPLASPRDGEGESDFISRCMGDEVMKREFPENDQRLAVCHKQFGGHAAPANEVRAVPAVDVMGMLKREM